MSNTCSGLKIASDDKLRHVEPLDDVTENLDKQNVLQSQQVACGVTSVVTGESQIQR